MNVSRILLVDDDKTSIFIATRALKKYNPDCTVTALTSGEEALQYITQSVQENNDPELREIVLLDITMPVMNGFLFINKFNKLSPEIRKRFKVLVYSSFVDLNVLKELLPLGVTGYIEKPLTEQKIKLYIFNDKVVN